MRKTGIRETTVVTDILCDICNESVVNELQQTNLSNPESFSEFATLKAEFGYGSERDGDRVRFDFCERCFKELEMKIEELKRLSERSG